MARPGNGGQKSPSQRTSSSTLRCGGAGYCPRGRHRQDVDGARSRDPSARRSRAETEVSRGCAIRELHDPVPGLRRKDGSRRPKKRRNGAHLEDDLPTWRERASRRRDQRGEEHRPPYRAGPPETRKQPIVLALTQRGPLPALQPRVRSRPCRPITGIAELTTDVPL